MTDAELHYKKTVNAIGFTMLIFEAFLQLFSLAISAFDFGMDFFIGNADIEIIVYKLAYGLGYLLCFMLPVIFLRLFITKSKHEYRPMKTDIKLSPYLPLIVLGGIGLIQCAGYINEFLFDIPKSFLATPKLGFLNANGNQPEIYEIVLDCIIYAVVPGICEEFLFRGAILSNLLPFGRTTAILISSLLFALMHQNVGQFFYAFVAGILLGIVYEKTQNIWNCVVLHALNNFSAVLEEDILSKIKDNSVFYAKRILIECGLIVLSIVALITLYLLIKKKKDQDTSVGFFEKSMPADDGFSEDRIKPERKVQLFCSIPMVAFFGACLSQTIVTYIFAF